MVKHGDLDKSLITFAIYREELVTTAKSIHEVLPVGLMWV